MSGDRYTKGQGTGAGPSTFSVYASRFLNGNGGNKEEVRSSQVSHNSTFSFYNDLRALSRTFFALPAVLV